MRDRVLSLDQGAGPGTSLGGLAHMRRPTQHHNIPAIHSAWVHPYAGVTGLGVFYNDGGNPPAPAPVVPSPADLAARAQSAPSTRSGPPDPLVDHETGLAMTQERFTKIMARENMKGRRNALKELADAAGVPLDGENIDVSKFADMFKQAEQARQAQLSDEQKRAEDLVRREKEFEERQAAHAAREADVAKRDRESLMQAALVRLGATGDDLADAAELLKARLPGDADPDAVAAAAAALKERRPVLFGAGPAPQALPPAPGGAPAGGTPPRTPTGGKNAIQEAARARARSMGLRTDDAA